MLKQIGRPLRVLAAWVGGWFGLCLLVLAIAGVGGGLLWERQRRPPVPPNATQVATEIVGDLRQMSFRYQGSIDDVRAFYRQALTARGWNYCGTQATARCTNLRPANDGSPQQIDVYRRSDDTDYRGATIEVWPIENASGQIYVTVFETRSQP